LTYFFAVFLSPQPAKTHVGKGLIKKIEKHTKTHINKQF